MAIDRSGKKTDLRFDRQANSLSGNDKISIKYEPTGNPDFSDMHICDKDTGKETMRVVTAAVPGGNALVIYGSGVTADGKQWPTLPITSLLACRGIPSCVNLLWAVIRGRILMPGLWRGAAQPLRRGSAKTPWPLCAGNSTPRACDRCCRN